MFCLRNVFMSTAWNRATQLYHRETIHDLSRTLCNRLYVLLIVIGFLPPLPFFAARGNCRVWEGDCASGGPGEVDCTRLLRMGPLPEGRAPQTVRAPGAGQQREAGGPPPIPGEHADQRAQLQGCPAGEGTARWVPDIFGERTGGNGKKTLLKLEGYFKDFL